MTGPQEPDPKTAGRVRQFLRLLMSYNDFKHATQIATHIVSLDPVTEKREGRWFLMEALNSAMIVAYCRPFSGNDRGTRPKIPDLPDSFLDVLDTKELEVHATALSDRNSVLAHSDSAAWNLRPLALAIGDRRILMPVSSYTRAPLTREATEILRTASDKLMEAVFAERMRLEPDLIKHFKTVSPEDLEREAGAAGEETENGA
jgi:hypothetical protein